MDKKIMLVDDDPIFNWVSSKMIHMVDAGLKIDIYQNARKALDFLVDNFDQGGHYIIFLDLNMPEMSGWEFLEALENNDYSRNESISVYIVSSSTDQDDIEKSKTYPLVKGYLIKPLSLDVLQSIM